MKFTEKQVVSLMKIAMEKSLKELIDTAKSAGMSKEEVKKLVPMAITPMVAMTDNLVDFLENPRGFEVVTGFDSALIELPKRGTMESACYDFKAIKDTVIKPGEVSVFDTGVKAYMPYGEVLKIYVRSSIGIKRGLMLANGTAIIDSDYYNNDNNEGHIMIALRNMTDSPVEIKAGERIAQGMFQSFLDCGDCPDEARSGGIGSTGK